MSQNDLPSNTVEDALRIARALNDHYAGAPTPPLEVAIATGIKPSSSNWRYLTGASVGYGLTEGGYNAQAISLAELGRRIVAPTSEGDNEAALREAALKPTVMGGFLRKYDGHKFPRDDIAKNVLRQEFGVPASRLDMALDVVVENARIIKAFREFRNDRYVFLGNRTTVDDVPDTVQAETPVDQDRPVEKPLPGESQTPSVNPRIDSSVSSIFVGHSEGTKILDQVKQLLELGDLKAEVAVEQETSAIPVPDKVFEAMSRSDAAIICVTADAEQAGHNGYHVNPNVLIEIGAAYVRHDKRLVLLWDRRVKVPSNLQGLYRCEFEGDELSLEAGMKLQKALITIKRGNAPEPE